MEEQDATPWWVKSHDWFTQALPYLVLVMVIVFGLLGYFASRAQVDIATLEARQEAQERVAFEQCRSDNDTRQLIGEVLDVIAAPRRPTESDAQYQARIDAFEDAKELLVLNDCPPQPEEVPQ